MPFGSLWIPVILSAVAVFIGSSIIHMVLKYHSMDVKSLPNEVAIREALGKANAEPGFYFTPYFKDVKEMATPAIVEKFTKGPVASITVRPKGAPSLGMPLVLWFFYSIFVSFVAAYVARHTLHPGDNGMLVMRITGTVAFAAYGFAHIGDAIWMGKPWGNTMRYLIDALIYSLMTGLIFRLLWPAA